MYLTHLGLTDFRSYESVELGLEPGTTVFLGPNGSGKTNLVEAVEYLATLGSHRVAAEAPLIREGCETATVAARVRAGVGDSRSLSVAVDIRTGVSNRALLNRAPVRPRQILGAVRTVMFAPEDLAIVRGDPAERRRFIDDLVGARWPRLVGVRAEYDKALRQKTTLLKSMSGRGNRSAGAGGADALGIWNQTLAIFGAELVAARLRTLLDIGPLVSRHYDLIAARESTIGVSYQSSWLGPDPAPEAGAIQDRLRAAMADRHDEEIARGQSLAGPHRDDLALSIGGLPVRGYASHGEGWSYALALKLASLSLLQEDGVEPILILDDVFAELDQTRRAQLVEAMASVDQTLVTAAVADDLPEGLKAKFYAVTRGTVTKLPSRGGRLRVPVDGGPGGLAVGDAGPAGESLGGGVLAVGGPGGVAVGDAGPAGESAVGGVAPVGGLSGDHLVVDDPVGEWSSGEDER